MFAPLACVAACAATLSLGFSPSGAGASSTAPAFRCGTVIPGAQPMASRSVTIQGVRVAVSVDLTRDMMPGVGKTRTQGVQTQVSLRSSKKLPPISSVRVIFKKDRRETWKPSLSPVATFAADPKSAMYSASKGPRWQSGTNVTADVLIVSKGRTYVVSMPLHVQGAY